MIIPPNKIWVQNRSDVLGSMAASSNLELTEERGVTKVSPRMIITTDAPTSFGTPWAFRNYLGKLYAGATPTTPGNIAAWVSTNTITNGGLKDALIVEGSAGGGALVTSNDYSDMEVYNNTLAVTGSDTNVVHFNGSAWTAATNALATSVLTADSVHKLLNFVTLKRLYATTNLVFIDSCSTDYVFTGGNDEFALNLLAATGTSDMFITSILEADNLIWILTADRYNNNAYVYTWDGITENTISSIYPIFSRGALAGTVKDGTPWLMDDAGQLRYFNGSYFAEAPNGKLPIKNRKYLTNPISLKNDRWIHPNGMIVVDGKINILINNLYHDNADSIEEFMPSGIWEYDQDIGWYHKHSLTQYSLNGAATITDYGQNRIARVGALYNAKNDDRSSAVTVGSLVAGADYYTNASSTKAAVFIDDSLDLLQKYGYLVTSKIFSPNIQDVFGKIYMRFRGLLTSTDRVWIKYRIDDVPPVELTVTWTSGTTFTVSTASITAYDTDDEVEGTSGQGGGRCSQIVSKVDAAGTSTVTLSETLGASSGTAKIRFQHWKLASVLTEQGKTVQEFNIDKTVPWIQLKVCMLFTGNNEIYDFVLPNNKMQ